MLHKEKITIGNKKTRIYSKNAIAQLEKINNGIVFEYLEVYQFKFNRSMELVIIIILLVIMFSVFRSKGKKTRSGKSRVENKSSIGEVKLKKYDLTQSQFNEEINRQLDSIRGVHTPIFWVIDGHRTHPWSLIPGGCTVVVLFKDKACLGYDKVKRPDRYTKKITQEYICNKKSNTHYSSLEEYIAEIYLTSDMGVDLKRVWTSNSNGDLWDILEKYRTK
jgi:hypothetical protein